MPKNLPGHYSPKMVTKLLSMTSPHHAYVWKNVNWHDRIRFTLLWWSLQTNTHQEQYLQRLVGSALLLRYVGVIWFIFMFVQLLPIRFTQPYSCCVSKSTMKHLQKLDWKSDFLLFGYGYRERMFVDYAIGYIGPPNCVHYWVKSSHYHLKMYSNFFWARVFMMFALWSSSNHAPIKYRGLIKKMSHLRPIYLTQCQGMIS